MQWGLGVEHEFNVSVKIGREAGTLIKCCNADILHMAIASEKVDLENILGTL
jgi:hypothetical protein